MEILILGILVNTLLFGYMAFTNEKTGLPPYRIPLFFQLPVVNTILTFSYPLSFLIILLAPGGFIRNVIVALFMQFVVNHFLWGTIVGTVGGLDGRKKLKENQKDI